MTQRFFKIADHGHEGRSHHVRLADVVSVSNPYSPSSSRLWHVDVALRNLALYQIIGEMDAVYRARDELLAALELDAKEGARHEPA